MLVFAPPCPAACAQRLKNDTIASGQECGILGRDAALCRLALLRGEDTAMHALPLRTIPIIVLACISLFVCSCESDTASPESAGTTEVKPSQATQGQME